jgi:NAD(P)H-dependent FMN reductase
MNLIIISSSQRQQSQSSKVAQYIRKSVRGYEKVEHIELCKYKLPLWDGEQESKQSLFSDWSKINERVYHADAFILITPEWSGMASPLLKNFLLMANSEDTGHKPALLVSISSGVSGAYPIAELRMNAFKNNKLVAIPDHLIIRNVSELLNEVSTSKSLINEEDERLRDRIGFSLHNLFQYSQALVSLRNSQKENPFVNQQQYNYGM